jgi:peptidoglycan/xylan/chitin deacetylase (PgdA/CDA1 family)
MMERGGVTLGAHSHTHRSFPMLSHDEVTAEIVESTKEIAAFVGTPPRNIPFAYPFGAVTTHAQHVVGKHCSAGFTCHSRPLSALDPRTALPRINMDGRALAVARSGNAGARAFSFARETLRRQARLGPAWTVLGPLYLGLRKARAKWKRKSGVKPSSAA